MEGADGIVYRKKVSGAYEYHHKDIVGGTGLLTDAAQAVVASYDYYAFGSMRLETGSSDNTHQFTGKEYDSTFRLYYFFARYYDPYVGRFISRDPIAGAQMVPQMLQGYAYAVNNPLSQTDSTGALLDILFDIGSVGYDIYQVIRNPRSKGNWLALGADVALAAVPFVPAGAGVVKTALAHGDEVAEAGKAAKAIKTAVQIQRHHIFPKQFKDWFAGPGRRIDIDQFTVELERSTHLRGVHGRGGLGSGGADLPGHWNKRWEQFIKENPDATAKGVFQFGDRLMKEFGLSGLPIVPYR